MPIESSKAIWRYQMLFDKIKCKIGGAWFWKGYDILMFFGIFELIFWNSSILFHLLLVLGIVWKF